MLYTGIENHGEWGLFKFVFFLLLVTLVCGFLRNNSLLVDAMERGFDLDMEWDDEEGRERRSEAKKGEKVSLMHFVR